MVEPNSSIDKQDNIHRISLERTMTTTDCYTGFTLQGMAESDSTTDDISHRMSKNDKSVCKPNQDMDDTMAIEGMNSILCLQSEEQRKPSCLRRNSAAACMLSGIQVATGSLQSDSAPPPRQRYQRRNSAVASMLFPSMVVQGIQHTEELARAHKNGMISALPRRFSVPHSNFNESSYAIQSSEVSPKRKKRKTERETLAEGNTDE